MATLFSSQKTNVPLEKPENPAFSISLMICGINTSTCATYIIDKPIFTLGKASTCDGVLDFSEEISREHARICWENGAYTITDLNSMNGTFLNGQLISSNSPQPLHEGDRLGFSTLLFSVERINR